MFSRQAGVMCPGDVGARLVREVSATRTARSHPMRSFPCRIWRSAIGSRNTEPRQMSCLHRNEGVRHKYMEQI